MDWHRLARYVISERVRLGYRSRGDFAAASRVNVRVLSDIEKSRRANYDPTTLAQLEHALNWRPGSVDAVLAGGDPVLVDEPAGDEPAGDRAVVLQIVEIMQSRYSAGVKLQMIEDVLERDFVAVPSEAAGAEDLAS